MIEYSKGFCENAFKNYEDLKMAERGVYSCAEKLFHELFMDEEGEQILENIMDAELYNRSFEDKSVNCDPNTWENWLLNEIKIENSHVFFIYENEMGTEYSERLEYTDIVFLEDVIKYIKKELDNIEN